MNFAPPLGGSWIGLQVSSYSPRTRTAHDFRQDLLENVEADPSKPVVDPCRSTRSMSWAHSGEVPSNWGKSHNSSIKVLNPVDMTLRSKELGRSSFWTRKGGLLSELMLIHLVFCPMVWGKLLTFFFHYTMCVCVCVCVSPEAWSEVASDCSDRDRDPRWARDGGVAHSDPRGS